MPGERLFPLDHDPALHTALQVVHSLESAGYQAYLVGGCVRDMLLGKVPADYDVTTNARPDEVKAHFSKTIPTGIKHGTVSVLQNGHRIEVTTFRQEGGYEDGRRPDRVEYVNSLEADLSRRDFTVNSMAMDKNGTVIDPFGGRADLHDRVIRAVGNPHTRFSEDTLRIPRAVRFAAQLGAAIDPKTWEAICRLGSRLVLISRERIRDEWNKIVLADVKAGVDLLAAASLLGYIFEDVRLTSEKWAHAAEVAMLLPPTLALRQAAFFHSLQIPEDVAAGLLRKLKQPNCIIREVESVLSAIPDNDPFTWTASQWKSYLFRHGSTAAESAMLIASVSIAETTQSSAGSIEAAYKRAVEQQPIWSIKDLAINGDDLLDLLPLTPGPLLGSLLKQLAEEILLHSLPNQRKILLERARELVSRNEFKSK